ncbi:MAG: glucuronate isomerase [Planctomycetes bacterium]|nr:glucuronate isomerase [Planctomycetota bacterium]
MSTSFIHDDFLLQSEPARRLYHECAADLPIVDFHSHLPPGDVATDRRFGDLAEIWLAGDHYKWRAMRANGVAERFCTGDAAPYDKFLHWAATVPRCLGNPLYHWTHLELWRPFGIRDRLLGPDTAASVWQECNARLATPEFSARGILRQMRVEVVCTTDDPTDDLAAHRALRDDSGVDLRMLPTFRPDRAMAVDRPEPWNAWIDRLGVVSGVSVRDYDDLRTALERRHDAFHALGCRASDHGLESIPDAELVPGAAERAFATLRGGGALDPAAAVQLQVAILHDCGLLDARRGWVQQLHLGAQRNNRARMLAALGPDTGFDSIGDWPQARGLARFLDRLDRVDALPKTILYNNNPRDNAVLATMAGTFQDGSVPGKLQFGAAWWHLDTWDGMTRQLRDLSSMGLLSRFVGMLTDSRSFLSFPRHDYFRRLLCDLLGRDVVRGALPDDHALLGELVRDVCHGNAVRYFGFDVEEAA